MGTDIHIRVERKNDSGKWEVVKPGPQPYTYGRDGETREDWPTPRNYFFFALVAGVRNGTGFAGVKTHEPIVPLSEPRGLPDDMASAVDADEGYEGYEDADAAGVANLGDHSFTWALLSELQEKLTDAEGQLVRRTGVVDLFELAAMPTPTDQPKSWAGGVSGSRVIEIPFELAWEMSRVPSVVEEAANSGLLFVARYEWRTPMPGCVDEAYRRLIFEEWPKFGSPENVRVIMGFDS